MATETSVSLYRGADTPIYVDVVTVDGGSTPQTMTGWALEFMVTQLTSEILSKTTGSGITIGNGSGTDDRATITVAAADTANWAPGRLYRWALWRTDSGNKRPLAVGSLTVLDAPQP